MISVSAHVDVVRTPFDDGRLFPRVVWAAHVRVCSGIPGPGFVRRVGYS
jgi:hypothetical protein